MGHSFQLSKELVWKASVPFRYRVWALPLAAHRQRNGGNRREPNDNASFACRDRDRNMSFACSQSTWMEPMIPPRPANKTFNRIVFVFGMPGSPTCEFWPLNAVALQITAHCKFLSQ
jgi:hypothetical protein